MRRNQVLLLYMTITNWHLSDSCSCWCVFLLYLLLQSADESLQFQQLLVFLQQRLLQLLHPQLSIFTQLLMQVQLCCSLSRCLQSLCQLQTHYTLHTLYTYSIPLFIPQSWKILVSNWLATACLNHHTYVRHRNIYCTPCINMCCRSLNAAGVMIGCQQVGHFAT